MKLIVAGSRDFNDYDRCSKILSSLAVKYDIDEIVCGMARGADLMGLRWAKENGVKVAEFHADWDGLGKRAGYVRNEEMARYGTHLLAFWDGASRGTGHMVDLARRYNLKVVVVEI